jgi:hypothetical protein
MNMSSSKTTSETSGSSFEEGVGTLARNSLAAEQADPGGKFYVGSGRPKFDQLPIHSKPSSIIFYIADVGRFISVVAERDGWFWGWPCNEAGVVYRTEPPISIQAIFCGPIR